MLITSNHCWCSSLPISLCLNAFIFMLSIRSAYYSDSWPSIKFWSYHILLFVASPSDGFKTTNRSRNRSRASVINLPSGSSDMPGLIGRSILFSPSEAVAFAVVACSSSSSAAAAPPPTSSPCALLGIPSVLSAATSLLRCLECRKVGPVVAGCAEWTVLYSPYLPVVILHKASPADLTKQLYTTSRSGPILSEILPEYRSWLESLQLAQSSGRIMFAQSVPWRYDGWQKSWKYWVQRLSDPSTVLWTIRQFPIYWFFAHQVQHHNSCQRYSRPIFRMPWIGVSHGHDSGLVSRYQSPLSPLWWLPVLWGMAHCLLVRREFLKLA